MIKKEFKKNLEAIKYLIFPALVIFSILFIAFAETSSYGNSIKEEYKTYTYIVLENDTLWNISSKFKPKNISTREFIKIIKKYNSFIDGNSILVGDHLNIPIINSK